MDTNETTIYTAILITGIVFGTIFLYFTITIYRNHRRHFKLLNQQFVAEVDLLEKERARIASDLHDELGPMLALTQIQVNSIESTDERELMYLEKANENIQQVTERLSGIAKNLSPGILIKKGLEAALKDFINQIEETGQIKMNLSFSVQSGLDVLQSLHLYRMIQELIHNTIKHSKATMIEIQLKETRGKIYLLYADNGLGVSTKNKGNKSFGLGLGSLKNRTEMLGGKMDSSTVKKGIEYFFEFPIIKMNGTNKGFDR